MFDKNIHKTYAIKIIAINKYVHMSIKENVHI